MKVLVVGLGALGNVYACMLKSTGLEVYGYDKDIVVKAVENKGVRVSGIWGEYSEKLTMVSSDLEKLRKINFDIIIVTVKSYITEEVIKEIKCLVTENTDVFLFQNGYGNYEAAIKHLPENKIILGRIIFGAETLGLGESKVTVIADDVIIGSPKNLISLSKIQEYARIFSKALIPTQASDRVLEYIWAKIIYNSALNTMGAIFEVNYGKLAENEYSKDLMESIIREIFALLDKMGQHTLWPDADSYIKVFYDKLIPTTAAHHASMLQDINNGRRTEIAALNGAVVNLAKRYKVDAEVNKVVVNLVKTKEFFAIKYGNKAN
ncbi:MAG: ketopantoate reductase family protein [Eubacteriales bacterium]